MRAVLVVFLVLAATPAIGQAAARPSREALCLMLESAATSNRLPLPFLARVIWRESRFDPRAVGPLTRGGGRAEGIAQFMPTTAAERDLADPFDPVEAVPKAAAYLASLRDRFGNLGLAAARLQCRSGARARLARRRAYAACRDARLCTGRDGSHR